MVLTSVNLTRQILRRLALYLLSDDAVNALNVNRHITQQLANPAATGLLASRVATASAANGISAIGATLELDPAFITICNAISGAIPTPGNRNEAMDTLGESVESILNKMDSFGSLSDMLRTLGGLNNANFENPEPPGTPTADHWLAQLQRLRDEGASTDSLAIRNMLESTTEWFTALQTSTRRLAALEESDLSPVSVRSVMNAFSWGPSADGIISRIYDIHAVGASEVTASGADSTLSFSSNLPVNDSLEYLDRMMIAIEKTGCEDQGFMILSEFIDSWNNSMQTNSTAINQVSLVINAFWKLAIISDVAAVKTFESTILTISPDLNLERPVQSALMTTHRAKNFYSWQLFTRLQGYIAMSQILIHAVSAPEIRDYINGADATILQSLDDEAVLKEIAALPVASSTAAILEGFSLQSSTKTGVAVEDTVHLLLSITASLDPSSTSESSRNSKLSATETSNALYVAFKQYIEIVRSMRHLVKSPTVLEMYKIGATIASSTNLNLKPLSRDLENYPIIEVAYGAVNDGNFTSPEDAEYSFTLPYPLNASNSSLLLSIASTPHPRGVISGEVLPYSYASMNIAAVTNTGRDDLQAAIYSAVSKSGTMCIADIWRHAVPLYAVPKRVPTSMSSVFIPNKELIDIATPMHIPFPTLKDFIRLSAGSEAVQELMDSQRTITVVPRSPIFTSPIPLEQHRTELAYEELSDMTKPYMVDVNLHRYLNVDLVTLMDRSAQHPILRRLLTRVNGSPRMLSDRMVSHSWMSYMASNYFVLPAENHKPVRILIPRNAVMIIGDQVGSALKVGKNSLNVGSDNIESSLTRVVKHGWFVDPMAMRSKTTVLTGLINVLGNIWPAGPLVHYDGDRRLPSGKSSHMEDVLKQ